MTRLRWLAGLGGRLGERQHLEVKIELEQRDQTQEEPEESRALV
jgi:hypothetical protein